MGGEGQWGGGQLTDLQQQLGGRASPFPSRSLTLPEQWAFQILSNNRVGGDRAGLCVNWVN